MSEEGKRYAVRLSSGARDEILDAYEALLLRAGEEAAQAWQGGLMESLRHLSTSPNYARATENHLFPFEVRAFPYRFPGSSVTHRVLFHVAEETPDGPQVWVLRLRPGAAGPMPSYEVREIAARAQEMGGV